MCCVCQLETVRFRQVEHEAPFMSTNNAGGKIRFGLMMALGIIVPGLIKYFLTQIGYSMLGTVIFFTLYLTAAIFIWFVWIRPLELTGSSEA